ncbi:TIR domain-containing protein [Acrocarpospora sp. B8E8]|uniref:TIR domain-containing protein n=1 Tax=Acrocarpospora sp. B8E8 TaxID=3153572 RepID=UPI00325C801C
MPYRNKTYVAFDSEDIRFYRIMQAWRANEKIDFDFFNAHELNTARDTSEPATIRRRLRERLNNTKQVVALVSETSGAKSERSASFLYYEIETIVTLGLPVVFANLNGARSVQTAKLPRALLEQYTVSVSFQSKIIKHALDNYVDDFAKNLTSRTPKKGPCVYGESTYKDLDL